MTESTDQPTAPQNAEESPNEPVPAAATDLARVIGKRLDEPNIGLLHQIIEVIGAEQANAILAQTLEIEAGAGLMVKDGSRRRTPGGVFMHLARGSMPVRQRNRIWPRPAKAPKGEGEAGGAAPAAPVVPMAWDEAKQLISESIKSIGEAKTVKITLVGRPGRVIQQQSCVVVAMKGKEPPSLPKGLPTPPANSAVTWAVFIATKQWAKVAESLAKDSGDQVIIEGYPLIDPKSSASVVLATSVKSVAMERAGRAEKK